MDAFCLTKYRHTRTLTRLLAKSFEVAKRVGAADPVARHAAASLELQQRARRTRSEDAVDATGIKAQPTEFSLQRGDVVAAYVRRGELEQSVTQRPACFYQGAPRGVVTDTTCTQAARFLKARHGCFGGRAISTDLRRRGGITDVGKSTLQISDGLAALTRRQGEGVK